MDSQLAKIRRSKMDLKNHAKIKPVATIAGGFKFEQIWVAVNLENSI